jgi:hypothetical protein
MGNGYRGGPGSMGPKGPKPPESPLKADVPKDKDICEKTCDEVAVIVIKISIDMNNIKIFHSLLHILFSPLSFQ